MPNDIQTIEDLLKYTGSGATTQQKPKGEQTTVEKFEEKMADVRLKEKEMEAQAQASQLGLPYVNLKGFPISPESLRAVPFERAKKESAVCFLYTGPEIRLAATDPKSDGVKNLMFELQERYKANGGIYKISEESLRVALKAYDSLPQIKEIVKGVQVTDAELEKFKSQFNNFGDIQKVVDRASVTDIITIVMASALRFDTSDVHVEAEETKIALRFRIDGVLQDVATLPHDFLKKIVARIKLISGLKINITNKPRRKVHNLFERRRH